MADSYKIPGGHEPTEYAARLPEHLRLAYHEAGYGLQPINRKKPETLLEHIHQQAFVHEINREKRDCGCVFATMSNGDVVLEHCPRHIPS